MVIEITKKHIIAAIVGLTVGVGLGIGVVMLVNHDSPSKKSNRDNKFTSQDYGNTKSRS